MNKLPDFFISVDAEKIKKFSQHYNVLLAFMVIIILMLAVLLGNQQQIYSIVKSDYYKAKYEKELATNDLILGKYNTLLIDYINITDTCRISKPVKTEKVTP